MSSAATFLVGMMVGTVIGFLITLAHTEFEPSTNRLFFKKHRRDEP